MRCAGPLALPAMPADSRHPAPFDTSTFLFPADWHAFSDLLGGSDTGLICVREGAITHVNAHLAERLGFDDTELIGQPADFLFLHGNAETEGEETTVHLRTKSGKVMRFHVLSNRIDTLHDASSTIWVLRPESVLGSEDTGAAIAQTVAEQLPGVVLVCGPDTSLRFSNRAFGEMTGGSGGVLSTLVHNEDRGKLLDAIEKAVGEEAASPVPVAFRLRHHDGAWRHFAGEARRLDLPGDADDVLLSASDVTHTLQQQQNIAADKKRQLHYLNRLLRLAQQPNATPDAALKVIVKSAAKGLAVQRCAYWEVSDDPSATRCVAAYDDVRQNYVAEEPDGLFSTSLHPLLQQVVRNEQHMVVADVDQDPRAALYCEYFHAAGIKALMAMPVPRGDRPAGLLLFEVLAQGRRWRKDEAEFGHNVAALIGRMLARAERARESRAVHRDSLTGLPNRHFLFDQSIDLFPKAVAGATTAAAFFIDLDGFKRVNDAFGHAVGDELLKASALRLQNVVRKEDILVRLGGDEFMLLAHNLSNMRIADDIAGQIVDSMRGVFSLQGHELQISASVGIAIYPFDGADIDTLMKKADAAMYQAKSAGRDQYQVFSRPENGGTQR